MGERLRFLKAAHSLRLRCITAGGSIPPTPTLTKSPLRKHRGVKGSPFYYFKSYLQRRPYRHVCRLSLMRSHASPFQGIGMVNPSCYPPASDKGG